MLCLRAFWMLAVLAVSAVSVPQCPPRCICVNRTVRCMYLQLENVPQFPTDTTILDLRFNRIRDIPAGTFSSLKQLNTLLLNNNQLTSIKDGAFAGLPSLRFLYLYKNRIHSVGPAAFHDLPKLEQLYLHYNTINKLDSRVFQNLHRLERLFLHNNKLQSIPAGLFANTTSLKRLRLDSNALVCDCSVVWLVKMLRDGRRGGDPQRGEGRGLQAAATCQSPDDMMGKSLSSMKEEDFHCKLPQIMHGPDDIVVRFGGTALFTCQVAGDPAPQVVWMRNSNEIPTDDPRYHVLEDGSLRIDHSQDIDMGEYECMAKSSMGEAKSRSARMTMDHHDTIEIPATTSSVADRPRFTETPDDQIVTPGSAELTLRCSATGNPPPVITWTYNGSPLIITTGSRYALRDNGSLVVTKPAADDAGTYRCQADNQLGHISAVAEVRINVLPNFTTTPENLTLKTGGHAQFQCEATGIPTPRITWYKDNRPVRSTTRIFFGNDNTRLHVNHVKQSDSGRYLCRATNVEGTREVVAILRVQNSARAPPRIVFPPYDIEAFPGSSIELPCKSEGDPTPVTQWRRDGSTLDPSPRYRISTIGSLYITNVSVADIGRYECSAINDHGRASGSGLVTIKDESNVAPGDRFVRIAFAQASKDIDNAINQTVTSLFGQKDKPPSPAELYRLIRFPNAPARELARAAEVYERTLVNIRKHVEAGMTINLTSDFNYKELLSPSHLDLVARLSGCMAHRRNNNCSDMCFHSKYRSIDGTCNNLQNPTWGASLTGFRRALKPIYENGFSQPVGWTKGIKYYGYPKPSARSVSTSMISTETITPDEMITHMVMQWGQFLDHDLDHAIPSVSSESWDGIDCKKSCEFAAPCYPMEVPPNDPRITNRRCIDFIRSSAICGSGMTSVFFDQVQPREQINQLTSYVDASQVYGFTEELAKDLRNSTNDYGLLREGLIFPGHKPLLPFAESQGVDCRRDLSESDVNCFVAGDIRANEQVGLLAMHTLWFREHNRIAHELRSLNSHWDGDTIYHEARKVVGSEMQHITYAHWLPHILGADGMKVLGEYKGYNPNIHPGIANVFATAALRFGHSLINPVLHRLNSTLHTIPEGNLPLHKAFFAPWRVVDEGGIDPLLRGLYNIPAKLKMPEQNLNSDLTERLFKTAHAVALDLAAMNIQRSRDHAIPGYNDWRVFCNMSSAETFDDLKDEIKDNAVREKLRVLYGHPGNVDVWVGGILEDQMNGAKVGPLFRCLLIEQFRRLRDGDRFWYENPSTFKPEQLTQIKQVNLGRILCDNGDDIKDITENVFILPNRQGGYVPCSVIPKVDLRLWADCDDCSSHDGQFNTISNYNTNRQRRNSRRARRELEVSFPGDKPSNASASVIIDEFDSVDNEVNDERIEGIESLIENLQKTLKQMRRKIRKLEQQCAANKQKHGHCTDVNGKRRINNELWSQDPCTQCVCENHQINCTKLQCSTLRCDKPRHQPNECCPVCPDVY